MKSIILPEGTTYVRFDELAELLAGALNPDAEQDGDNLDAALATIQFESDLRRAVQSGDLRVCNPLTHLPLTLTSGQALKRGVVMIHDLREFAARLGLSVEFEETRDLSEQESLEERAELTAKAVLREAPAQKPPAVPVPSVSAPAKPMPVVTESASKAPAWTLRKPERYNGYTAPLHRLLADAHMEGKPCPTARDVVEAWRNKAPAEVAKVLPDGIDYYDAKGNTKHANLAAIRKAIGRLTSARQAPSRAGKRLLEPTR